MKGMREDFRQFARWYELWIGLFLVIGSPTVLVVGIATGMASPSYLILGCLFGTFAGAYYMWKALRASE
jgi:hypothetical protein